MQCHTSMGPKWSAISATLHERSAAAVRNRFQRIQKGLVENTGEQKRPNLCSLCRVPRRGHSCYKRQNMLVDIGSSHSKRQRSRSHSSATSETSDLSDACHGAPDLEANYLGSPTPSDAYVTDDPPDPPPPTMEPSHQPVTTPPTILVSSSMLDFFQTTEDDGATTPMTHAPFLPTTPPVFRVTSSMLDLLRPAYAETHIVRACPLELVSDCSRKEVEFGRSNDPPPVARTLSGLLQEWVGG